ncbi:MAG: 50S ribosomal protein L4 [Deltaproteobacteria bacterium]|nr:MAG: 50S ribosomal protein L4 [Deltaproteobacteria bacterium]
MPTVTVRNKDNEHVGEMELNGEVFNVPIKPHVLHEVVNMQLAKRRAGAASTKGRSEVRGGGRKPWRQKGTGRARAGTRSSPLWRGGGVTFGPKPREYGPKVSKKIRKQALKMALSSKLNDDQMVVLDSFGLSEIRTKAFVEVLQTFGIENVLVVIPETDNLLERSARNVPYTKVLRSEGLNVYDILRYRHLVLMKDAVSKIESALLGQVPVDTVDPS